MLAAMLLDLMVPPLAAFVLVLAGLLLADAAWWGLGGHAGPLFVAAAATVLLVCAVAMAWRQEGRCIVTLRELLSLPLYVAAKIPVYARLFTKRQVEWVRTKRDEQRH